jgi:dTDP-4-dehydrorhamnose 3,5-epimerase
VATDDRGHLRFVNNFDVEKYQRFYLIENYQAGFVRAWHGHKLDGKAFFVTRGAALVGAVRIDDWDSPSTNLTVDRVVLSSEKPAVFEIPPGYANGFMALEYATQVLVFSMMPFDQAADDDYRFPARYWDIWSVEER